MDFEIDLNSLADEIDSFATEEGVKFEEKKEEENNNTPFSIFENDNNYWANHKDIFYACRTKSCFIAMEKTGKGVAYSLFASNYSVMEMNVWGDSESSIEDALEMVLDKIGEEKEEELSFPDVIHDFIGSGYADIDITAIPDSNTGCVSDKNFPRKNKLNVDGLDSSGFAEQSIKTRSREDILGERVNFVSEKEKEQ